MGKKLSQFMVWGGKVDYKYPLMIWAEDIDIAFYKIARGIEPSVTSAQWTGEEIEPDKVLEAILEAKRKEGKERGKK